MSEKKKVGVIYILTNPSFPDYVKIGYTEDIKRRLDQLNNSECIPYAFRVHATYDVSQELQDKELHKLIDRLNPDLRATDTFNEKKRKKEFYAMSKNDAYDLLQNIASISGTLDNLHLCSPSGDELVEEELADDVQKQRRGNISLFKCGLKIGDKLEFLKRPNEIAIVKNAYEVEYNNETWRISPLATKLLGKESENRVSGSLYWTYNGETLQNIRDRREEEGTYQ